MDLFGSFSNQIPVCDCLLTWIFEYFIIVKGWLRLALQHKALNFADRIENMRNPLTHSDDIALYLLTRMYDKHAYIHNKMYGWSTLLYMIEDSCDDLVAKCDIRLFFIILV